MTHFFISYTQADRAWAEWIAWQLEEAGYSVIIQAWDFRPGDNFVSDMQKATAEAERTIAVLSPDYLASKFTEAEWTAAFANDPTGEKGLLIPVRVRDFELKKGLLPQIVYIDLVNIDEPRAKERLLSDVKRERAKPSVKPVFPGASRTPSQRIVSKQPRFPGTPAPIWNVPRRRNPNFTGCEELLSQIHAGLASGYPVALYGLGGVGKTQIALEYAYRYATDYDIVWWVHADTADTLIADTAALATPLELPAQKRKELSRIAKVVMQELAHKQRWLVIYDGAPSADDLRASLPVPLTGHVLITSRNKNWLDLASTLEVREFKRDESVEFLLKRTGQWDNADAVARADAAALAKELGDLALALDHAGAYVEASARSLADYFKLFRSRQKDPRQKEQLKEQLKELLKKPQEGTLATSNLADLWTTWELNFQEVQQASPAATELLNLCAFLAPDAIPLSMLCEHPEYLPPTLAEAITDDMSLDKTLATLLRYSLIDVDRARNVSIHTLVQLVTRNRFPEDQQKIFAAAAIKVVNAAFPSLTHSEDFQAWPHCMKFLPHALTAAELVEEYRISKLRELSRPMGQLLNKCGLYFFDRAEFDAAKRVLEWALRIDEATCGPNHPIVARDLNNLSWVLKDIGQLVQAKACLAAALSINKSKFWS
jgi:tetratricopeptide (TPR) repeat protein